MVEGRKGGRDRRIIKKKKGKGKRKEGRKEGRQGKRGCQ